MTFSSNAAQLLYSTVDIGTLKMCPHMQGCHLFNYLGGFVGEPQAGLARSGHIFGVVTFQGSRRGK